MTAEQCRELAVGDVLCQVSSRRFYTVHEVFHQAVGCRARSAVTGRDILVREHELDDFRDLNHESIHDLHAVFQ